MSLASSSSVSLSFLNVLQMKVRISNFPFVTATKVVASGSGTHGEASAHGACQHSAGERVIGDYGDALSPPLISLTSAWRKERIRKG
jgi:hypothetical protein